MTKNPHAAQRQITHQRRAAKPHSALLANAKKAWSRARQKAISKEERVSHINSLMEIVRGKIQDIVLKHDASRVVQTIVKRGNQRQRDEVATELQGRFKELVENRYAKVRWFANPVRSMLNVRQFLVARLAHFCPSQRLSMIVEFRSHVIRLLLHREASQVIADIFELRANATERAVLLRDFYGREAALLPLPYKGEEATKDGCSGLSVVLQNSSAEQRRRILASLSENLNLLLVYPLFACLSFTLDCRFNNSDKGSVRHAIVHRALWEYLSELANFDDSEREKLFYEIFERLHIPLLCIPQSLTGTQLQRPACRDGTY